MWLNVRRHNNYPQKRELLHRTSGYTTKDQNGFKIIYVKVNGVSNIINRNSINVSMSVIASNLYINRRITAKREMH